MSNASRLPPPKREVALALLEESSMFIHLDPRRSEVMVPKLFVGQPQLVLQVGRNYSIPIPDLRVDEFGISCTLSFNGVPFLCKLPWHAIYALIGEDGRGQVWPDDVPPEVQFQRRSAPPKPAAQKRPRPRLAEVTTLPTARTDQPEILEEEPKRPTPIRRGPTAVPPLRAAEPSEPTEPTEPEPPPPPRPSTPSSGGKKKREIPPYLRVIK